MRVNHDATVGEVQSFTLKQTLPCIRVEQRAFPPDSSDQPPLPPPQDTFFFITRSTLKHAVGIYIEIRRERHSTDRRTMDML